MRPRRAGADPAGGTADLARFAAWLLGQSSALAALLFYFGSVRSRTTLGYFSVDPSMVGYTTTDFAFRSINSLYAPLLVFAAFWLAATLLLRASAGASAVASWTVRGLGGGVLALASVTVGVLGDDYIEPRSAVVISAAGALTASISGAYLGAARLVLGPAVLGGILLLFLAVSWQAEKVGREIAESFAANIRSQPELVIRSDRPIGIADGGGVRTYTAAPSTGFRYETQGLRLLTRAGGNYILLRPEDPRGSVTYLPVAPEFRIEVVRRAPG